MSELRWIDVHMAIYGTYPDYMVRFFKEYYDIEIK